MKWLALLFWLCFVGAIWSLLAGNPTAINGVVGAGVVALVASALAIVERS